MDSKDWIDAGDRALNEGALDKALMKFQAAIRLDELNEVAFRRAGTVLNSLGRYSLAASYLRRAHSLNPTKASAVELTKALTEIDEYAEALEVLQVYLQKNANHYTLFFSYVILLMRLSFYNNALEAIVDYEIKIGLNPNLAYIGAQSALKLKRWDEADRLANFAYGNWLQLDKNARRVGDGILEHGHQDDILGLRVSHPNSDWAKHDIIYNFLSKKELNYTGSMSDVITNLPISTKYLIIGGQETLLGRLVTDYLTIRGMQILSGDKALEFLNLPAEQDLPHKLIVELHVDGSLPDVQDLRTLFTRCDGLSIVFVKASLQVRYTVLNLLSETPFKFRLCLNDILCCKIEENGTGVRPTLSWPLSSVSARPLKGISQTTFADFSNIASIKSYEDVTTDIFSHVKARKPYSLVRLGDGEGFILGYKDTSAQSDVDNISRFWFGQNKVSTDHLSDIRTMLMSASWEADAIGLQAAGNENSKFGIVGKHINDYGLWNGQSVFCSQMIHYDMESNGFFSELFALDDCVSVITPRNVRVALENLGAKSIYHYPIPEEAKYANDPENLKRHYPDEFNRIIDTICVPYRGAIFLIGGGVLGKIYASVVKRRGGIAIDIGGIFDLWSGHKRIQRGFARMADAIVATASEVK